MNKQKVIKTVVLIICTLILLIGWSGTGISEDIQKEYVGSEVCKDCHEDQYDTFQKYSKKAKSFNSIQVMKKGLNETELKTCFQCHTTGYGQATGFRSEHETPHLKNAGCEACHGPGSIHVDSEDPEDIKGELSIADCEACHNSERVEAFKFKPMIFGGAH